jgi:hypothetical protein
LAGRATSGVFEFLASTTASDGVIGAGKIGFAVGDDVISWKAEVSAGLLDGLLVLKSKGSGGIVISWLPVGTGAGFGFSCENRMRRSCLKVVSLRSASSGDFTTIVLKKSMKEESTMPSSTNAFNRSI